MGAGTHRMLIEICLTPSLGSFCHFQTSSSYEVAERASSSSCLGTRALSEPLSFIILAEVLA